MTARHELSPTSTGCDQVLVVTLAGVGSRLVGRLAGGRLRQALATENRGFATVAGAAG